MNIQFLECSTKFDNDFIERTLIDIACIESGMLKKNKIDNKRTFFNFMNLKKGIPILVPYIPEILDSNKIFNVEISDYSNIIFGKNSEKYIGTKLSYNTNLFVSSFKVKSEYRNIIDNYIKEILNTKFKISQLKNKYKTIGAFQTRNIPHLGHEKIIKKLLNECDYVVINPVIGPKKNGDVRPEVLKKVYNFYIKKFFNPKKVFFKPIIANMFYSGPREAIHHALIRQTLGFDKFIVGRDHAGAEGVYKPNAAPEIIKKFRSQLKIKVITHQGSYYCLKCKRVVLKDDCKKTCKFINISGTEFRKKINLKKPFKYARPELNNYLKTFKERIFYND